MQRVDNKMHSSISERMFRFISADPTGPVLPVPGCNFDPPDDICQDFEFALAAVGEEDLMIAKEDSIFQMLYASSSGDVDRLARGWVLLKFMEREIPHRRLQSLLKVGPQRVSPPYHLSALQDLPITADYLIPLAAFHQSSALLLRNRYAFCVVPPIDAQNGSHWLTLTLWKHAANAAYVRLDPLFYGPESTFPEACYKVWWYGQPLDWGRLSALSGSEHGRWLSMDSQSSSYLTDFIWIKRVEDIHFICEELPKTSALSIRGSRYFHAVYSPALERLIHVDGAIRIYSQAEWVSVCA